MDDRWRCSNCDSVNNRGATRCVLCEAPRPGGTGDVVSGQGGTSAEEPGPVFAAPATVSMYRSDVVPTSAAPPPVAPSMPTAPTAEPRRERRVAVVALVGFLLVVAVAGGALFGKASNGGPTTSTVVAAKPDGPSKNVAGEPSSTASAVTVTTSAPAPASVPVTVLPAPTAPPTSSPPPTSAAAGSGAPAVAPGTCGRLDPSVTSGTRSYRNVDPVNLRTAPRTCADIITRLPAGTAFRAYCVARGDTIAAGGGGPHSDGFDNNYWIYTVQDGQAGWVSDSVLVTGADRDDPSSIPSCF